ncbi:MAG: SMC-Scp complex subunit ScpB [Terriglobales bacterium]
MSLKSKVEAIIYAAEEPVSVEQMAAALKDSLGDEAGEPKAAVRAAVEELIADYAGRGMEIRLVAGGYRMSTKPEFHDVVRAFAKNLKPPVRLSLPALETLSVIAYKQPVTLPEINEIRGVDSSAVIATLLDRKLITTAGRKAVVGRPILYRTTREFLLRFGLRDMSELPTLKEYEELASQAELFPAAAGAALPDATGVPDEKPADDAPPESENVSAANSSD